MACRRSSSAALPGAAEPIRLPLVDRAGGLASEPDAIGADRERALIGCGAGVLRQGQAQQLLPAGRGGEVGQRFHDCGVDPASDRPDRALVPCREASREGGGQTIMQIADAGAPKFGGLGLLVDLRCWWRRRWRWRLGLGQAEALGGQLGALRTQAQLGPWRRRLTGEAGLIIWGGVVFGNPRRAGACRRRPPDSIGCPTPFGWHIVTPKIDALWFQAGGLAGGINPLPAQRRRALPVPRPRPGARRPSACQLQVAADHD